MPQTVVQEASTIRFGSAMFEVGLTVGALVNVGAIRDGVFEESFAKVQVDSDNAGTIHLGIRNHRAALSGNLMEINLDVLAKFMAGVHTLTPVAGAPVAITDETHILNDTVLERFDHKNHDGTEVTIITVCAAPAGAGPYILNTDYTIAVDPAGYTGVARIAGAGIADGSQVYVNYTYTPAASRATTAGGLRTLTAQVVRFTNTDAAGHIFRITIYKATAESGVKMEFPADEGEDPAVTPVKMMGVCDPNRAAGDQLFEIYDEQHV